MLENLLVQNNLLLQANLLLGIINAIDIDKKDKELLLLLLQNRDKNYIRINNNRLCYENIQKYLNILRPIEYDIKNLVRIGGKEDGGYVMITPPLCIKHLCHIDYSKSSFSNKCYAVSLGVSNKSPWDLEMAELGYQVLEYDASIDKSPYNHKNIEFHKLFIGTSRDKEKNSQLYITIDDIIESYDIKQECYNILQIDIENAEWEILDELDLNKLSKYFQQIIFEFHGCNPEENDGVIYRCNILKKLNQLYYPYHVHFNNHGKIFYSNGLFFSTTIEVSYVRKNEINDNIKYKNYGIVDGLDFPVDPSAPEIPIRFT